MLGIGSLVVARHAGERAAAPRTHWAIDAFLEKVGSASGT